LANTPGAVDAGGGLVGINYGTRSRGSFLYATQGGGSTAIWKYDAGADTWTHQTDTPAAIGPGGGITSPNFGEEGTLVVLQGGESQTVWSLDVAGNSWKTLPPSAVPVSTGGAISNQFNGCNFALAGGGSRQFFATGDRDCVVAGPPPDFYFLVSQPTSPAQVGTKVPVQVTVVRSNRFIGKVTLSSPTEKIPGIKAPEEPIVIEGDSVFFKIKIKGGASPGTYLMDFTGASDSGKSAHALVRLVVQ
jgi:hypothetical protein